MEERWYLLCADVGEWRVIEGEGGGGGEMMESTALEMGQRDDRVKRGGEGMEGEVEEGERS